MESLDYELREIERIISEDLANFVKHDHADAELLADFKDEISGLTERIKNDIQNALYTIPDERQLARYIQLHQISLIRLAGRLTQYADPTHITNSETSDNAALCCCLLAGIEELLGFLKKQFPDYFNEDIRIPQTYQRIVAAELSIRLEPLRRRLAELGVREELTEILTKPLTDFILNSSDTTHRRIVFLKKLVRKMNKMIEEGDDPSKAVCEVLIYLNHNATRFYAYCTEQFEKELDEAFNLEGRLQTLARIEKWISQLPEKKGFMYNCWAPSIKTQLLTWIVREQDCLLKQSQYAAREKGGPLPQEINGQKSRLIFSVPELAYFIKVLIDVGVLMTKNLKLLAKMLSHIFSTKTTDHFSDDSLYRKYFDVEDRVKREVLKKMVLAVKFIRKDLGLPDGDKFE